MAVNPGARPGFVRGPTRPVNPATGGHYIPTAGGFQLIHAIGPGKWAPGPPGTKQKTSAPATRPAPATNPYTNPLYDPTQTLTGKPLYRAVQAETNLQYDPTINQLTQQIGQNTRQGAAAQAATAGYYNQLAQYAQNAAQNVTGVEQGLGTQLKQIGQDTQTAFDQFAQRAATPALQQLAAQGLGGGAPEQLAANIANAKLAATQQSGADQAFAAKVGAAQSELAGKLPGIYATGGQQRLGQIAAATRLAQQPVETKLATTRAEKNAAFGTNLMAARAAERNYGIAQQGLGLRAAGIASTANTAAANRRQSAANVAAQQTGATQRNQANIDARALQGTLDRQSRQKIADAANATRQAIASGRTSAGAGKPASPAAQRTMWNQITQVQGRVRWLTNWLQQQTGVSADTARTQAWQALNSGRVRVPYNKPVYDPSTGSQARNPDGSPKTVRAWHVVNIPNVGNTPLLNAAYNSAVGNGLTPGDVAYLHSIGFTIGNLMPVRDLTNQGLGPH